MDNVNVVLYIHIIVVEIDDERYSTGHDSADITGAKVSIDRID